MTNVTCKKICVLRITILCFDVKIYFERRFILSYRTRMSIRHRILRNDIAFFCLFTNSKICDVNFVQLIFKNVISSSSLKD